MKVMNISHVMELNELAREDGKRYGRKREIFDQILSAGGKHFTGIVGPRGVGKTVLLKQIAVETKNSCYISLDTIEEDDLFEVARVLVERYKIKLLLLDEIHFQDKYEGKLKKIYDFLDVAVIFTGSVSLSIFESSYDLSRRVNLVYMHPFSFREYIFFKKGVTLPALTLDDIDKKVWDSDHMRYEYLFEDYLKGGIMPFALEEPDIYPALENILRKIIQRDIPRVARLHIDELNAINKTIQFIGKSPVDGINYTSISRNVGITKYKAEAYIRLLEQAFVIHVVFPEGTNVLREPKVLMSLPYRLLFKDYDEAIGALREDFFAEMMKIGSNVFYYLKTKRGAKTPDYLVKETAGEMVVEIGGRGKGKSQFKGVEVKRKLVLSHDVNTLSGIKRPLFLLGFIERRRPSRPVSTLQ